VAKKNDDLEELILSLLQIKQEISVPDVAQAAGLSQADEGDRKAIRRRLIKLVNRGVLEAIGAARARVYVAAASVAAGVQQKQEAHSPFKEISLSRKSESLLKYVSQSIRARKPVGYNQDFLRSYLPNKSFYLTTIQRAELLKTGTAESIVRPAGTYARNVLSRLLIDLAWNSSRLEGNTYSLLETKRLIELGESALGKNIAEAQMILNHKRAIEYVLESVVEVEISLQQICSIHALLSENLLGDPSASGRIRQIAVSVGGTNYLPLENPHILKECFQIFIEKLNQIADPFEQSFFALVQLSYLQAFEDVNKRTARLVANIPLAKGNLRPLSFIDVDNEAYVKSLLGIYEKNDVSLFRDLYLWAYARSAQRYSAIQQSMGEPNLIKLKFRSEIQEIIRTIILEKVAGPEVVRRIRRLVEAKKLPEIDAEELFKIVEIEIISLHEGNIARFKIRPSEFQEWKSLQ
jgi:Fic family protein